MKFRVIKNKSGRSTVFYKCPKCHAELESDLNEAGMDGACPDCHTTFILPGIEEKKAAAQIRSKTMSLTALSDIVTTGEPDPLDKLDQKRNKPKPDPGSPLLGLLGASVAPKAKPAPAPELNANLRGWIRRPIWLRGGAPPAAPSAIAPPGATRECPYCGETINIKATKCRFCRESLVDDAPMDGSGLIDIPSPRAPKPVAPPAPPPLPPPVADAYFIATAGTPFGPLTRSQLRELASKGKLNAYTLAWREGMPQWLRISKIPELASLFAAIPPPLPEGA